MGLRRRSRDLLEHPLHPARLELEDPEGVAPGEELERLLVVQGDRAYVHLLARGLLYRLERLLYHVEVPKSQEVHLQETQRLDVAHRVLNHYRALVPRDALQGHDLRQRLLRDDDTGRVRPGVAGEALYLEGGVEDLLRRLVPLYVLDDVARRPRVLLASDVPVLSGRQHVFERRPDRLIRDELGELVGVGVGVLEDPAGVPDSGLRPYGPEGDDLGYVLVPAILVCDVPHHLAAPLYREVYVHVWHADSVGIQEALEEERVLERVEVGDLQRVRDDGAGRRPAPGSNRYLPVLGVLDEVPHDEEVVREAHLLDGSELEVQPALYLGCDPPVPSQQSLFAPLAQVVVCGVPCGLGEVGKPGLAKLYGDVLD
jgi:hypothetical protein